MLVHASSPLGILYYGPYTIYGINWKQGPSNIPYDIYLALGDSICDATYRELHVREIFHKACDEEIAFKYSELKFYPEAYLDKLAKILKPYKYKYRKHKNTKIRWLREFIEKNGFKTY